MVKASDEVLVIGGGDVGRDEMIAAMTGGKRVVFFGADMNHTIAINKAAKKNLPAPTQFKGSAEIELETKFRNIKIKRIE